MSAFLFSIKMNTDEKYGRLRCISAGEEGSYLYGPQPFEFIAADSIDVNATVVEIEASISTGGGGASSITSGTKDTLSVYVEAIMAIVQMKAKNIGAVPNEMKRKNIELSINKLQVRLNKLIIKKGNEKQQQILAKSIEQFKARLAYETAKTPTEKQNALASMEQMAVLASETAECKSTAEITIKKENRPPVIEQIAYNPSRRYFTIDSLVTVTAQATDPDGDAVTISYLPSQSFKVANFGPNVVTITAKDSKGAVTEKRDTIFSVYVSITPYRDLVKDGENIEYKVFIIPATISASSVQWSWEPKDTPAGNSPSVNFSPDNLQQKVTVDNAKWYAFPDSPCGSKSESVYKFKATTVLDEDIFEPSAEMVVFVPDTGGITTPPYIIGEPSTASLDDGKKTTWFIYEKNTLNRQIGSISMKLPSTSQFYNKTYAHENKHRTQQISGLAKDIWTVNGLWKLIEKLNAPTLEELKIKYIRACNDFNEQEDKKWKKGKYAREKEAYEVGDQISPFYLYQSCNRFK
jgi:hypothetical protein